MTFDQAKELLDKDRKVIEQALSDLKTVKALYAIGENDKAVNLFASIRRNTAIQLKSR